MRDIRRWAIYFAPTEGELARFGADWLGWDAQSGLPRDGFDLPGLPAPRVEIVGKARRYGFHATLKAPFFLAEGCEPMTLDAEISALAARLRPVELPLELAAAGDFVALVPTRPAPEVDALAAACVTGLDRFRAPPSREEIARRHPESLTTAQFFNLERWGYPDVLDCFQFHMTLTAPLGKGAREAVVHALGPVLAPLLAGPIRIRDLCLFGEDGEGMFHLLKRFPLG